MNDLPTARSKEKTTEKMLCNKRYKIKSIHVSGKLEKGGEHPVSFAPPQQ